MRVLSKKSGVAIVLVVGFLTLITPILIILYNTGSAQTRQAMLYHDAHISAVTVISGLSYGISRLRADIRGPSSLPTETLGNRSYSLHIRPTGQGFFLQDLYYIFTHTVLNDRRNALIMADVEQFHPDEPGDIPVTVLTRNFWFILGPFETSELADCIALENYRGAALLRLIATRQFETNSSDSAYKNALNAKYENLPDELNIDWTKIVNLLVQDKISS